MAVLFLALGACRATGAPVQPVPKSSDRLDPSLLTGAALADLNARGQFDIPPPQGANPPEITEARARDIARLWTRDFAPFIQHQLERERGAPIDLAHLTVCPRVFYAASPYVPLGPDIAPPVRRRYGPWYLVSMCASDSTAQLSVAVSAYSTQLQIINDRLRFPMDTNTIQGNEIVPVGISHAMGDALPLTPEQAVTLAAKLTGKRITQVPDLIAPIGGMGVPPQFARWHITLEAPIHLRGAKSGATYSTPDVYLTVTGVRAGPQLMVTLPNQPSETISHEGVIVGHRIQRQTVDIHALRRGDRPVLFEPATLIP